ncbi:hypothetical protein AB4099_32535 [Bosea sp. 2KB_26]|uniref:hypothetical protein n=1 Tax=Bosea sp. 2KB_26 TaxID=3237475 RepID=UPI003F901432
MRLLLGLLRQVRSGALAGSDLNDTRETSMISGSGVLVTKDGGHRPVTYEYVRTVGGIAGQLAYAGAQLDPGLFADEMQLECHDGALMDVALSLTSDNQIGFVGLRAERAASAQP